MSILGEQVLFRAYVRNTDRHHLVPVYEQLVQQAGHCRLAGATVLPAIMGFGPRGFMQTSTWRPVNPLPVIVEIVDSAQRLVEFIEGPVHQIMRHGLITLERAGVMLYRHRAATDPAPPLSLLPALTPLSTVPQIQARDHMQTNQDGVLLRIFAGDSDRCDDKPLHEAIVHHARQLGLAGATVLRGSMGFGANSRLHTAQVLERSTDLPVVIELVDAAANIQKLLPFLEQHVQEGMITMESVRILMYRQKAAGAESP